MTFDPVLIKFAVSTSLNSDSGDYTVKMTGSTGSVSSSKTYTFRLVSFAVSYLTGPLPSYEYTYV